MTLHELGGVLLKAGARDIARLDGSRDCCLARVGSFLALSKPLSTSPRPRPSFLLHTAQIRQAPWQTRCPDSAP
jgi:hypothetical protein